MVNEIPYDFQSITIEIAVPDKGSLGIFAGADSISYESTFERERFGGSSRYTKFVTEGTFEGEGSLTMARYQLKEILNFCRDNGIGYGQIVMDIAVIYGFTGEPTVTDTLERVQLAGVSQDHEHGADALMVELPLMIGGRILLDGVPPYAEV